MKDPYECPRCGYETPLKQNMYKHLYEKKKPCQGIRADVLLTEDVKYEVMQNRTYKVKPICQIVNETSSSPTIHQNITHYNQINTVIGKIDLIDRLTKYMQHHGHELLNFDEHITQTYHSTIQKLDNDEYRDFCLSQKCFLEIIDTLTVCNTIERITVLYDEQLGRIRFTDCGTWKSKMLDHGIDEIMSKIQGGYLDYYEEYLLRKVQDADPYTQQVIKERLIDYYKLLVCFDMLPCVKEMHHQENPRMETMYNVYRHVKNELRKTEATSLRNQVSKIIRRNSIGSVIELNKRIMELIQVDEGFKDHVLEQFSRFSLQHIGT